MNRRTAIAPVALATLACAGLFGPVTESDERLGRGTVEIPRPSTAVETGFADPAHRSRVGDALCFGEPAVWGQVEQAVASSLRNGENFADVTGRYASIIGTCDLPAHCGRARQRFPNSDGEIQAFWLHVLATCGDVTDRALFRDLDVEPRAAATFYTAKPVPPHRVGADDGALMLATERLIQRGGNDPILQDALWSLLRLDNPEAAERMAALVPIASLHVEDEILKGLAGQSHPDAAAIIEAECAENPDKQDVCGVEPKAPFPTEQEQWVAKLAATPHPDRVRAMLAENPEFHDAGLEHLSACGEPCSRVKSLVDGDTTVSAQLDALGVTWRSDRMGGAAFGESIASGLHGRGRLARIDPGTTADNEVVLRHLVRILELEPAEHYGSDVIDPEGQRKAGIEIPGHRFEIAVEGVDLDACITLVNHALQALDHGWILIELAPSGSVRQIAAVPVDAAAELTPPG